ncbi:hypothetical protein PDL71_12500 [Lacibacter sp. MH-610]|uniref:hypothetical protein n=1 Tax=Lacibacter sp. MH-610 TaxID=3020883 RepID=UPI0038911BCB
MKRSLLFVLVISCCTLAHAQMDTLPNFSVKKKAGVITVSWASNYKNASQINIQRSKDSNRNFITIHSTPNPNARSYSFEDKLAKYDTGYYRVFVLFEGTNYFFTKPKRAIEETGTVVTAIPVKPNETVKEKPKPVTYNKPATETKEKPEVEINSTGPVSTSGRETKKTIKIPLPASTIPVKKAWEPSVYVYTADDGNVEINLPDALKKNYSVTFLREEGRPVFALPQIKQTRLKLDKASFLKSGWYYFELRENGKVVERNKFLITRDN